MDGNGRWAARRRRPRQVGHRMGARAVRRVVEAAPALGIDILSLYAFSADNWRRPPDEVAALMDLFRNYVEREADRCRRNGVALRVIGRRDRLPPDLVRAITAAEVATAAGDRLTLRIAVDYSGRDAICRAAARLADGTPPSHDAFGALVARVDHSPPVPPVDLLIRTGGERRLSDFLLWECAYAELYFVDTAWPDFTGADLQRAVADFAGRERRFGGIAAPASWRPLSIA